MLDRWVRISAPTTQDTRVDVEIQASNRMKKFIDADSFFAEYSSSIEEVPDGVLTVPAVANIAPVCWATDADLFIDTLDRRFFDSLRDIQHVFSDFYSILKTSADMVVNETADTPAHSDIDGESGSGILFSGGVDSLTTLVRHHAESPTLFTFKIKENYSDRWKRVKSLSSKYSEEYNLKNQFIRTNCQRFINVSKLSALFGYEITDGAWWSGVQHGMGLLGLCAPVAYDDGLSDLYIASSYTEEFNQPWGSHPAVDDKVAWSGTTCHHDGFELSRQQKIALLVSHVEKQNTNLMVRVCTSSGENCSRCEKCCRTIIGLIVAGADPTEHGFTISEDIFDHIRTQIESGNWKFGFDEVYMWSDIQKHTPVPKEVEVDNPELASFYRWLRGIDLENYQETSSQGMKQNVRDALVRNLPYPYFDVISLLYSRLKFPESVGR